MDEIRKASPPTAASAGAAAGAAKPPLDLSLGHIGTKVSEGEIDFATFGQYVVELDYGRLLCVVSVDAEAIVPRAERRAALRKVQSLLRTAAKSGMAVSWESGAP